MNAYTAANNGRLPQDVAELKPHFETAVDDGIIQRYKMLRAGHVRDVRPGDWLIAEKAPVDKEYDTRLKMGLGTSTIMATGLNEAGDPEDAY